MLLKRTGSESALRETNLYDSASETWRNRLGSCAGNRVCEVFLYRKALWN